MDDPAWDGIRSSLTQIHAVSENLSSSANEAFDQAQKVQSRVESIGKAVEASRVESLSLLSESAQIREVVSLLQNIVDSTHVLGINASIVAARSGPSGRAFAVVSQEIRKLADDSSKSLKTIESLVVTLQTRMETVAHRIEESGAAMAAEKESLLAVAGSLQGTILGVDVVHAMTEQCQRLLEKTSV